MHAIFKWSVFAVADVTKLEVVLDSNPPFEDSVENPRHYWNEYFPWWPAVQLTVRTLVVIILPLSNLVFPPQSLEKCTQVKMHIPWCHTVSQLTSLAGQLLNHLNQLGTPYLKELVLVFTDVGFPVHECDIQTMFPMDLWAQAVSKKPALKRLVLKIGLNGPKLKQCLEKYKVEVGEDLDEQPDYWSQVLKWHWKHLKVESLGVCVELAEDRNR
jgi:hypothetical protein